MAPSLPISKYPHPLPLNLQCCTSFSQSPQWAEPPFLLQDFGYCHTTGFGQKSEAEITAFQFDDFQAAVVEKELTQSMSRRGNCWDNAVQESFFGHFKDECHYEVCKTLKELQKCIDGYSFYYNNERGMWDRGKMTPCKDEKGS